MNLAVIILVVGAAVVVIVKRMRGEAVNARMLTLVPLVLTATGLADLKHDTSPISGTDIALLAVSAGVALALGALRGTTIELSVRQGRLWQRYRLTTLAAWAAVIAARFGSTALGHAIGAHLSTSAGSLLLCFGLTLAAESAILQLRAAHSRMPLPTGTASTRPQQPTSPTPSYQPTVDPEHPTKPVRPSEPTQTPVWQPRSSEPMQPTWPSEPMGPTGPSGPMGAAWPVGARRALGMAGRMRERRAGRRGMR